MLTPASDAQNIGRLLCNANLLPGELIGCACFEIQNGEMDSGHYAWIIPVNTLASLVAMVLAPLAALFNLVAAAINGFAYLCANKTDKARYKQTAEFHGAMAGIHLTFGFAIHTLKIFQPSRSFDNLKHQILG